jgi:hypothetical protein
MPEFMLKLPSRERLHDPTASSTSDTEVTRPRKEIALGTDYFLALQKYAELAIPQRVASTIKFGDALQRYLIEVVPTLSANTQHTHLSDAKHVNAFFSTAPIDQIRPLHIRQFLDRHKATPTTANRCKRLVSTVWNHARGWGYTNAQNPCEGIAGFSLRNQFVIARKAAANAYPELASAIEKFRFYDLRAKAADDTSDERGEQAASDLLGHENVKTTQRHYLRRGRIVPPTK